jgi:hypothetical protein
MNPSEQNMMLNLGAQRADRDTGRETGEATLRLIAQLPAPEGLEDRVQAQLRVAPRRARVLSWPAVLRSDSQWMRSAAAAAIVFVVVGGGWGVYSRVQQPQPARVIVMPPRVAAPGSFSSAAAIRTPNTLNGPVVANPATKKPAEVKGQDKLPALPAQKPSRRLQPSAGGKTAHQPVVPQPVASQAK